MFIREFASLAVLFHTLFNKTVENFLITKVVAALTILLRGVRLASRGM
jgi:hypothetical protein